MLLVPSLSLLFSFHIFSRYAYFAITYFLSVEDDTLQEAKYIKIK